MNKRHWRDAVNLLVGTWIYLSPWLVKHSMVTETPGGGILGMWDLWTVGLLVFTLAGLALFVFGSWEEWMMVALGRWLAVSPWVLGFTLSAALTWNAVIFGILIASVAAWALPKEREVERVRG